MYGRWTETVVLWRNFLGIIWDFLFKFWMLTSSFRITSLLSLKVIKENFFSWQLFFNVYVYPCCLKVWYKSKLFIALMYVTTIDSNTDLLRKFQLSNMFLNYWVQSTTIPDVNPRDFKINALFPWVRLVQIFQSTSQYFLQLFL